MCGRWKGGESLNAIGRALGKDHVVIQLLLAGHGGIAPVPRIVYAGLAQVEKFVASSMNVGVASRPQKAQSESR